MIVYLEIGGDKIDDDVCALFEKALIDAHRNPYMTAPTVAQKLNCVAHDKPSSCVA